MFQNFRKNSKVVGGMIAFFLLLFFNSNGMAVENASQQKFFQFGSDCKKAHPGNYNTQDFPKSSSLIIPSSFRRKAIDEKNNIVFDQNARDVVFSFYSTPILESDQRHLFQTAIYLPILRGPPFY